MNALEKRAREYLTMNAAESGADALIAEMADELAGLWACIKWTDEVYPDRIYGKGARVELLWDEFNAMREAAGLKPRKRIDDDEKKSGLNHRLRVRIKELETQLAAVVKVVDDKLAQYDDIAAGKGGLTELGAHAQMSLRLLRKDIEFALTTGFRKD